MSNQPPLPVADPATRLRPLQTVPQVALVLNVSEKTVTRLINSGKLKCVRIGARKLVSPDDIETFIAQSRE